MTTHFTTISGCTPEQLKHYLAIATRLKAELKQTGRNKPILEGKTLAVIFEKPSLRTRVSFAVGMTQLGGASLVLGKEEVGIGTREPIEDVARVLARMCDGIVIRTFEQQKVDDLAKWSNVPVINGLSDAAHPCQAMADLMTVQEHFGNLAGRTLAFIGDGNNVARSLAAACGKLGVRFVLAAPRNYEMPGEVVDRIMAQIPDMDFQTTDDPIAAVRDADVIYTDTWVSMGQEKEKAERLPAFQGFCVDEKLLARAPDRAVVLHCLPAYRGLEISADVMEGPHSLVFAQAENRLHFQKGLIAALLGGVTQ
jgi:ornithine carbamoyltransferase